MCEVIETEPIVSSSSIAHAFYEGRLLTLNSAAARLSRRYKLLINLESALVLLLATAFYILYTHHFIDTSFGGTAVTFAKGLSILVVPAELLRRTATKLHLQRRTIAYYETRLQRLKGEWRGTGDDGLEFAPAEHAYADDLDIFGSGSLYEYLCSAQCGAGRKWLAHSLLFPSSSDEVRARQRAVSELRERHDLREYCAAAAAGRSVALEGKALDQWLAEPAIPFAPIIRITAVLLASINIAVIAIALAGKVSPEVPLVALSAVGIFTAALHGKTRRVIKNADPVVVYELDLLKSYAGRLSKERFGCTLLRNAAECTGSLSDADLRSLIRLTKLMRLHDDPAFTYISYLSLWGTIFALSAETRRMRLRNKLQAVSEALGKIEGLSSLAAYSFEHPDYPFAVFEPAGADRCPVFHANALGHPLIDTPVCVRNPVIIDAQNRFLLVSGSNMSGKSTYLRAVGVNAVLARAGAPVCAESLRLSFFSLATSMRVQDSLQDGKSRFIAEVSRVRQIIDSAKDGPLVFLLDELLSGTNSEDRRAGAAGVIARLLEGGASGVLTTHDLALSELVFSRSNIARNVHFTDHLDADIFAFDYKLREGIVPQSNGAAILRTFDLL